MAIVSWRQFVPDLFRYPAVFREDVDHRNPDEPQLTIPKAKQEEAHPQGDMWALPLPEQAAPQISASS